MTIENETAVPAETDTGSPVTVTVGALIPTAPWHCVQLVALLLSPLAPDVPPENAAASLVAVTAKTMMTARQT
jgi:hypothetical protein